MVQHPLLMSQDRKFVALSQLLQSLREADEPESLLQPVVEYLQREMNYSLVWVGLYDRAARGVVGRGGYSSQGRRPFYGETLAIEVGSLMEEAIVGRRLIAVANLAEESRAGKWATMARSLGIQGALLFPIRCREAVHGLVIVGHNYWGMTPRPEEKALLSILMGQLATTLQGLAQAEQQQRLKRPEEPLLRLLQQLRGLPSLEERLNLVVSETHDFIAPSRTSLYWFERENRYFWRRLLKQTSVLAGARTTTPIEIPVTECLGLYNTLNSDRLVSISDADSALNVEVSSGLMKRLQVQSLLIAPIRLNQTLLGFVAAEGTGKRIWTTEEKRYLQGVAQLVALVAPLEEIEQDVAQAKADQALVTHLSQVIYSGQAWSDVLQTTANRLLERLQAEGLLLLTYDQNQQGFHILFQQYTGRRQRLTQVLENLNDLDRRQLEQQAGCLCIEDWRHDLRLMAWRSPLLAVEAASVMACRTTASPVLETVLLLIHKTPRCWDSTEQTLFASVAHQLGVLLQQRHMEQQLRDQQVLYQALQWGMATVQQEKQPERLETLAVQVLAQLLQSPLIAILTWSAHSAVAQLSASLSTDGQVAFPAEFSLNTATEPLIQQLRTTDRTFIVEADRLTDQTRQWLHGPGLGRWLVLPLRESATDFLQGMVVVGDGPERVWSEQAVQLAGLLVSQLAWSRRSLQLQHHLQDNQDRLQQLNWYKHFCNRELKRTLDYAQQRLEELREKSVNQAIAPGLGLVQQALDPALKTLDQTLDQEQWQVHCELQTVSLTSLLRRVIERLDPFLRRHQLWYQVHGGDQSQALRTDPLKLEGVLHEVLVAACERCPPGGRLDIWCRLQDDKRMEITVTDNGFIDPHLMAALQDTVEPLDMRLMGTLDHPPGLHLSLCRRLMRQLQGSLDFLPLEDGRVMSQLIIPLA